MRKISPAIISSSARVNPGQDYHAKVLVVEDDSCLQTILTRLLHNIDPLIQIKWLDSADDAWAEMQTNYSSDSLPYNLIISDISTPGIKTGIDFWKSCQTRYPHTPFLFTSGITVDEFFVKFGNSTVCPPFLAKPFAVKECRQIMQTLLDTGKTVSNQPNQNTPIGQKG
jgi:DNA-binding NtrC family response regulator